MDVLPTRKDKGGILDFGSIAVAIPTSFQCTKMYLS